MQEFQLVGLILPWKHGRGDRIHPMSTLSPLFFNILMVLLVCLILFKINTYLFNESFLWSSGARPSTGVPTSSKQQLFKMFAAFCDTCNLAPMHQFFPNIYLCLYDHLQFLWISLLSPPFPCFLETNFCLCDYTYIQLQHTSTTNYTFKSQGDLDYSPDKFLLTYWHSNCQAQVGKRHIHRCHRQVDPFFSRDTIG